MKQYYYTHLELEGIKKCHINQISKYYLKNEKITKTIFNIQASSKVISKQKPPENQSIDQFRTNI